MKDDMVLLKHGGSVTEIKGSNELSRVVEMYLHSMFNAMDGSKEECLKFSISDYPNKYSSFNHFVDSYKQGLA